MTMMSVKIREDVQHSSLFCRLLGTAALIAVLSLLVSLLRPLQATANIRDTAPAEAATYVGSWSARGSGFRYLCDRASKDAREAINYYADPCEDFHSFACSMARDGGQRQRREERALLKHTLSELSLSNDSQDVAVEAGVVFRSCLVAPFSLNSTVEQNIRDLFNLTKLTKETLINSIRTPRDIFNIWALVSYTYRTRPFLSFETNASNTLTMRFSRPFSSYMNQNAVEAVFMAVVDAFSFNKKTRLDVVHNLVSVDGELQNVLAEMKPNFSLKAFASAAEKYISSSEWRKIVETHVLDDDRSSLETRYESERIEKVFNVLFRQLKPEEVVVYSMAHAVLPKQMIELLQWDDRSEACLRMVENLFETIWQDLETYLLGFFDESHQAESVATAVLSTLKTMLSNNARFADEEEVHMALAKLDNIRFDIPSATDFTLSLGKRSPISGSVSANSLYRNILLYQWSAGLSPSPPKNDTNGSRGRSGLSAASVAIPAEYFRPLSFCHGDQIELNFATLGTEVAAALLRYIKETCEKVPSSTKCNIISALTSNITACLERESTHLPSRKEIQQLALQATALQISLEAMKSRSTARAPPETQEEAPDTPARKQTFFVKYCQAQCARYQDRSSGVPTLDTAHACNLVVMNSPEFTRLFHCERGDPMVPAKYCLAL